MHQETCPSEAWPQEALHVCACAIVPPAVPIEECRDFSSRQREVVDRNMVQDAMREHILLKVASEPLEESGSTVSLR